MSPITFPGLGIEIDPSPVAFTVFGKDIYWYGLIIACGFLLAFLIMSKKAPRFGLTDDDVLDMILWAIPLGIIGARAYYCIFYWEQYRANPISCLYIWEGGLAIYGAVIGGVLGLFLYSKLKKKSFGAALDVAAFGVLIGQICGRWGNFFNREAHGGETASLLRMGLVDPDGVVRYYHPTFLYESVWNLIGFFLMFRVAKKRKTDGQVFAFYLLWYGLGRAVIEGMRTDSLMLFGTGIRVSQLLAALCVVCAGLWLLRHVPKADPSAMLVNRVRAEKAAAEAAETAEEAAEAAEEAVEAAEEAGSDEKA